MKKHIYNIAIIGSGQIGSRHLQGLARSSKQMKIYLIDPNENALILAKQRFQEVIHFSHSVISCHQTIHDLPEKIDIGIIATTANVRREVVENILAQHHLKYLILEKIVFQNSDDFNLIKKLLIDNGVKSWVYCARRFSLFYKILKSELIHKKISIKVTGSKWGLACNGIHMIDLFVFLTEQTDIKIDTTGLENIIINSKRNGFKELKGTLRVKTKRGDTLELIDSNEFDESLIISINTDNEKYDIFESKGLMVKYLSDNEPQEDEIQVEQVSELTGSIVDQILEKDESDLPTYDECMEYHIPMLDAFNDHISKVIGKTIKICPIT